MMAGVDATVFDSSTVRGKTFREVWSADLFLVYREVERTHYSHLLDLCGREVWMKLTGNG